MNYPYRHLGRLCISAAIRATVALPVPTRRAVFRMPVPAAREAPTATPRFRDQVAAREQVNRSIPLRSAGQKLKLDYNIAQ
jgi:hypothetical protein